MLAQLGIGLVQHGAACCQIRVGGLPLAILGHDFGQFAVRLGDFAVLRGVADDGGIGHLRGQLFEARFDLVEFVDRYCMAVELELKR